jgi:hypothetical protein
MDKLHLKTDSKTEAVHDKTASTSTQNVPPRRSRKNRAHGVSDYAGFYVRHHRHGPGHIIIYPPVAPDIPARIEFTTVRHVPASQNTPIDPSDTPTDGHLVVSANNLVGLKKTGLGLAARTAVGWALDAEGAGGTGLEVKVVRRNEEQAVHGRPTNVPGEPTVAEGKEETLKLSGIARRNELFDRLIALGEQRWEMY